MERKQAVLAIGILIAAVIFAGVWFFLNSNKSPEISPAPVASAECSQLDQEIDTLIQQANYCEVDADCVISEEAAYPGLCMNLVNKDIDVISIQQKKLEWQNQDCGAGRVYEACAPTPKSLSCQENKCVGVFDSDVSQFNAKIIGSYTAPGESSKLAVSGNIVYMTDISQGILAIDVSDPTNPKLIDSMKIAGGGAYAVSISGAAYVPHLLVGGYGNSSVVAVDITNPQKLEVFKQGIAKRSVQEITPLIDFTYFLAIDGPELEIFEASEGVSKGVIEGTQGGHMLDFDFVFGGNPDYRQLLLAAQGEKGLAIFDWKNLSSSSIVEIEGYTFAVATDDARTTNAQHFAYVLSGGELIVIDIEDSTNPIQRGKVSLKTGSADLDVSNNIAAVAIWMEGIEFIDVSDPDNLISLGVVDTPGRARDVELVYDSEKNVYYAYVADDRDDLQIIELRR